MQQRPSRQRLSSNGVVTLNADGTFTYVPNGTATSDSFIYEANGNSAINAKVTLGPATLEGAAGITCANSSFNSSFATKLKIKSPGVLEGCVDALGYPLTVSQQSSSAPASGSPNLAITVDPSGGFTAKATSPGTYSFTFYAQNSQGVVAAAATSVSLTFPQQSGLTVKVLDGSDKTTEIKDYRWIIEEDRTFYVDPNCTGNPPPSGCLGSTSTGGIVPNFGTNFHTSYMPVIATGCTGDTSCGSGQTVRGNPAAVDTVTMPGEVGLCNAATPLIKNCLDPGKRYYISVLPGDAAQPFIATYADVPDCSPSGVTAGHCGHGMGGAPIAKGASSVTVMTEPSPYPPATLSVFVFEDDYPLNGEHDAGGGIDVLSPNEPGLGGFQITLADDAGGTGDATGTPTYDMFNMPLSNSLAGTIDPVTKKDACPIALQDTATTAAGNQQGIVGMIITCPTYENGLDSNNQPILSPLAGQAVVKNLYQGRYGVIANPGADRIARGEEWLQTNTLDGQKAHDSFMRIGEPGYFQEFGPAGYHVTIGFANPAKINARGTTMCAATGADCTHTVNGHITTARMSRTPDERLYGSGTHDAYAFTQCYVSIGDPDGADFGFTKCDGDGNFKFTNVPPGNWKITTFDQWNDQVVDGITTPVGMNCTTTGTTTTCTGLDAQGNRDMGEVAVHQWQSNIYTRTFLDTNYTGVSGDNPGLPLVDTNVRFRDGSFSNFNNTDLDGYAGFNEVFPLFNWYVIETDSTRYKNTGTHVVYDSGGPVDNSSPGGVPCSSSSTTSKPCGSSAIAKNLANTYEPNPLPSDLSIPGAVYCDKADCAGFSIASAINSTGGLAFPSGPTSTGRIDPAWVNSYGWQGFSGQNNFLEFGKRPFAPATDSTPAENGGIHGHVVYASTRPFDDPQLLLQTSWEPLIPHVRVNLYKEDVAPDGVTTSLKLVDYTETSSFDDWAQGFRSDGKPNMNCPGQGDSSTDPYFYFALSGQSQWLDLYNNNGTPTHQIPHDSRYKCYDGMHNWNQLQPAPYDGMYSFPSVTSIDPQTGKPNGSNCTGCIANPTVETSNDPTAPNYDPYRAGTNMLPSGKYVVEVVVPPGFELVKEEDKNILIGDNFIAPPTQQFGGLGSIYILPDQASVVDAYNSYNSQNPTTGLGRTTFPSKEADTGNVETYWPCVGADHIVPDYISLFPGSKEVAPFAGATRHLCDRKEITLQDQTSALAKFYLFTETHRASHFTGVITDDFTAEFDPFSPQFGEKFGPAYLPISFKDWAGNEITRVYSDAWGAYNGLSYSTWEVNPPNPTGYGPTMMVGCMNDAGPISDGKGGMITDPLFQSGYSDFCYELPFMPGQTGYFDTPVVPTSAFAGDYNNPDCAYPDATPAVSEVDGDGVGPWVANPNGALTAITNLVGGSGYASAPEVSFTGGSGTGATATALISGSVSTASVTNGGRGYTSTPAVSFLNGGGSGATATATMTGSVASVTINNAGVYLRSAAIPSVTFSLVGAGCTPASGAAVMTNINTTTRKVSSVTINNPGTCYVAGATVSFSAATGTGTTTATGTPLLAKSVLSVFIVTGGSGYTSAPTVTFAASPAGGPATATGTATESAAVVAVNITSGGSGYIAAPTVSFNNTGTGGTGASASASIGTNGTLTINSLGDQLVDNYAYSGPSANAAPFNKQKITRHYGFDDQCTTSTGSSTCKAVSSVTIGGVNAPITSWSDTQIKVAVPGGVSPCAVQQQAQYGGSQASCGELVITAGNGQQSVDTVTVTIGGSAPKYVAGHDSLTASGFGSIQKAIDTANPGDLVIVPPGTYNEMLLIWKPVRLQGVGAASSVIDGNTQPAGKLNPWRQRVVCLFGLALNGTPISGSNLYDPTSTVSCDQGMQFSVDRLPLEATVGWDATLNGNLAEQLIEPTLMGAYEGAGITVLAKGVKFPAGSDPFASDVFPTGTQLLTMGDCGNSTGTNPYPSNFLCNPSSIDGLTIKDSSQGGGGILVHAWGHELQIANNRVLNNQGTLSGGITIGQGEHPDAYLAGGVATTVPGSCITNTTGVLTNLVLPYCFDMDVNVHNNSVIQNSSLGDELFSSTPAGAGGVTFCNGSDYYKFNYNWVCGNMSTGDGAGVAHIGFTYDGDIEHNTIMFNQTTNPTIVTNGGGLLVMGAPDQDPPCALLTDQDCVSPAATITPSDGTGPGLVINANMILGNSADSGSGGGLRLQHINGSEVLNFPNGNSPLLAPLVSTPTPWPVIPGNGHQAQPSWQTATPWNAVNITNNIIANNVAGWDGGGVSLQDALATNLVNNTIVSNNSTAASGVLFQTLFAPLASTQGDNCSTNNGMQSCPQVAGLVSVDNSAVLTANIDQIPGSLLLPAGKNAITCPTGHGTRGTTLNPSTSDCTKFSIPELYNDLFWQNRSLMIGVGAPNSGYTNQQNTVTVYDTGFGPAVAAAATQSSTGACNDSNASYWDIGVRGDPAPGQHLGGGTLVPVYSVLTNAGTYSENGAGNNNLLAPAATITSKYCNGSRVPVEAKVAGSPYAGWQAPPGTNESNALPAPPFTLLAAATVDEGNNWINLRWGPLSLNVTAPDPNNTGAFIIPFTFNPSLASGSTAINDIPTTASTYAAAPTMDFFGNPRKTSKDPRVDIGAIEVVPPNFPVLTVTPASLAFGSRLVNTTSPAQILTLSNTGGVDAGGVTIGTAPTGFARTTTCTTTLVAGASCAISVTFTPTSATSYSGTLAITAGGGVTVTNSPVALSGTGSAPTFTASVSPSPLAFGNWATGTTSNIMNLTVTNTGNSGLSGGTFTLGGGTPLPFSRVTTGTFPTGAPNCAATLAVGASCTIKVQFAPGTATPFSRSLTVAYTGATVTPAPVTLTGTGVATRAAGTVTPNPLTITLPTGIVTGSGTVTLTNTAAAGGAQIFVTAVAINGANILQGWAFTANGNNTCTGAVLAPGQACTVGVQYSNLGARTTRSGTITFTDNAATTPSQTGTLTGVSQ